jgi:hypothetical protein
MYNPSRWQSFIAYENPVTGRTCGYTLCGRYLRLYVSDSMSFSTTRLCDLSSPEHAEDVVAIVAFLAGPLQDVLQTYEPPTRTFSVKPPGVGSKPVLYEWVRPSPRQPPWKVLERRRDLWGRRTVAIGGQVRRPGTTKPVESMTMKFTWLPRYLVEYEQNILHQLETAIKDPHLASKYRHLQEALDLIDPEILTCRPRAVGMLEGCEILTQNAPFVIASQDGLQQSSTTETEQHLVLSAMCTINPHGRRINDRSALSLKDRLEILNHTFQSLYVAACSNIHYRDINTGNVLYSLLQSEDGRRVIGYLIDYGNARYLDERRIYTRFDGSEPDDLHVQLRLDDARSANLMFLCCQMTRVLEAQQIHRLQAKRLARYRLQEPEEGLDLMIETCERKLAQQEQELLAIGPHRYIDDLESAIYAHVYQVS